ncbi:GDSL-type esterase/lipase family protein [Zooshikella sp. RANM57]|uniref:GDSL-type esterase/lipase family protein n=1 Tax=Zooshikella sp. RANM57 TaxID=3425863 RepID=UPI003D6E0193
MADKKYTVLLSKRKIVTVVLLMVACLVIGFKLGLNSDVDSPLIWQEEIAKFQAEDRKHSPKGGSVLFVGSSSIRRWKTLANDFAPFSVIQRGFGGARLNDVIYYIEELIFAYQPQAIVLYVGSNDIKPPTPKSPKEVLLLTKLLVDKIHKRLPSIPVFYIAINPTPKRWHLWPSIQQANNLIKNYTTKQPNLIFIDSAGLFVNKDQKLIHSLFENDQLHLNQAGYAQWLDVIKPVLMKYLMNEAVQSSSYIFLDKFLDGGSRL